MLYDLCKVFLDIAALYPKRFLCPFNTPEGWRVWEVRSRGNQEKGRCICSAACSILTPGLADVMSRGAEERERDHSFKA